MRHQDNFGEEYHAIHEMFPLDDGDAWTENPVTVTGESVEDVKWSLMAMLHDIEKYGVKNYD
jgi:hypothetical protein